MSKIRRRQRCPKCRSLDIISWGIRGNHHRYRCNNCSTCFTTHREDVSKNNRFVWFRHRTKSQRGRHWRKLPKLTRRKGATCQKQEKTAETDTEKGDSVAEIAGAAIGTVQGRRQQLAPIFAPRTSVERPPAAIYPHFCSRNIRRTTSGSIFIPFLFPELYVNKKRFFGS